MELRRYRWRVTVPYVRGMLRDETRAAVLAQDPRARFVELPAGSAVAYARHLIEWWKEPGDTIIVEQDVIPPPGAFASLLHCTSGWCTHPMLHGTAVKTDLLGLVRWSAWLKRFCPQAMESALLGGVGSWHWPHWRSCDQLWARWAAHRDYAPCVHQPEAVHLKYPRTSVHREGPGELPLSGAQTPHV